MNHLSRYLIPSIGLALVVTAVTVFSRASNASDGRNGDAESAAGPQACDIAMTRALYGFQCHGSTTQNGATLEQVTFIGTVRGDGRGFFDGRGTFNSSLGSLSTHVFGRGTLLPGCFGHVNYKNELVTPQGTSPLPPVSFDYTVVKGGEEILGTGVATPPGDAVGVLVPRLTCRLVRTR